MAKYLHMIYVGRTGKAGQVGLELANLNKLVDYGCRAIPGCWLPGPVSIRVGI